MAGYPYIQSKQLILIHLSDKCEYSQASNIQQIINIYLAIYLLQDIPKHPPTQLLKFSHWIKRSEPGIYITSHVRGSLIHYRLAIHPSKGISR
jgi:hypothetical protein